jgi:hypothetical protein
MGDPAKIDALKKEISVREIELGALVEKAVYETSHSRAEIDIVLEEVGHVDTSFRRRPEQFDVASKLERLTYQIRDLRKTLEDEEAKP